jgi:hypothetical protein
VTAAGWIALGSLLVALGSLGVALGGYRANRRAISDEWAREWAAQRPVVYPLALRAWANREVGGPYEVSGNGRVLPLKNGGRGPALNVSGEVTATTASGTRYERQIIAGTIAAGDLFDARIVPHPGIEHWGTAKGAIRYGDLAGGFYESRFECSHAPGGELVMVVHDPTHTPGGSVNSPD